VYGGDGVRNVGGVDRQIVRLSRRPDGAVAECERQREDARDDEDDDDHVLNPYSAEQYGVLTVLCRSLFFN